MNKLNQILLALLASVSLTGCATTGTPLFRTVQPQSVENKAYAVTRIASRGVLLKHPEFREGMELAKSRLEAMATLPEVGVPELIAIVDLIPPDARGDQELALYIEAGLLFFTDELGTIVVNNPEAARAAARGMARALTVTLAQSPMLPPLPR